METGEPVRQDELLQRLGWLCELVQTRAQRRLAASWHKRGIAAWRQELPTHAWMAQHKIAGTFEGPHYLRTDSRAGRIADELAGRVVRSALGRMQIAEALLATWMSPAEWRALDEPCRKACLARQYKLLPAAATRVEIRNISRAIARHVRREGTLPKNVFDLYPCPRLQTLVAPLDAADGQFARVVGETLELLLPLVPRPRNRQDWAWHTLPYQMPAWACDRYPDGKARLPLLRVTERGARLQMPFEFVPPPIRALQRPVAGALQMRALGLDWGVRRLLTGAVVEPDEQSTRVRCDGRPYFFQAAGMQAHLYALRGQAQRLAAKIERQDRLLDGLPDASADNCLVARHKILLEEKALCWRHLRRVNEQLACAAAKWACETALAEDCNTIVLEDLSEMESRDLGRHTNGRCALQVRGALLKRIKNICQANGVSLLVVDPRGTSSQCSRCGRKSRYQHAPDRLQGRDGARHKNWLVCACGRSSDRDHSAAERIGARGLALAAISEALAKDEAMHEKTRARAAAAAAKKEPTPSVRLSRSRRKRLSVFPTSISAHRPCGDESPSSVCRGARVGSRQRVRRGSFSGAAAVMVSCSGSHPPDVEHVCDGLLGGFKQRLRASRVQAHAPGPRHAQNKLLQETS